MMCSPVSSIYYISDANCDQENKKQDKQIKE